MLRRVKQAEGPKGPSFTQFLGDGLTPDQGAAIAVELIKLAGDQAGSLADAVNDRGSPMVLYGAINVALVACLALGKELGCDGEQALAYVAKIVVTNLAETTTALNTGRT